MGLLLYKSDEMYSSTELIRKSKTIFNKVLDKEIDKAIILRDGKPCFLLMEFKKYEKIMAEYEELKAYVSTLKKNPKEKKSFVKKEVTSSKEPSEEKIISQVTPDIEDSSQIIPDKTPINEEITENNEQNEQNEISEDQEINNAMQNIESMNFPDDMKKEAEEKIRMRILQARKERAKILEEENSNEEELEKELLLQSKIEEEKLKKSRELQDFWD